MRCTELRQHLRGQNKWSFQTWYSLAAGWIGIWYHYLRPGINAPIWCKNCFWIKSELMKTTFWINAHRGDIRISFFEDKGRLQADSNGIKIWLPWDNLYQERKRETAASRKQSRIPTRPARPILLLDRFHWGQMLEGEFNGIVMIFSNVRDPYS